MEKSDEYLIPKINNANITFITSLTKNGISGNTTNIDSIVGVTTTATGADTSVLTGSWVRSF